MLSHKHIIDDSACPLTNNTVCIFCPHNEINSQISSLGLLYSKLVKECPVHQVFELSHVTATHGPNVYYVIDVIKSTIDKIGIVPNFWKAYEKFTQNKDKLFKMRKNYQYTHIDQQNTQVQLLVSAKCLLTCVIRWIKTGDDFNFGNKKSFQIESRSISLKYGCVAKMWKYLQMDSSITTFIESVPAKLLSSNIICNCSTSIDPVDLRTVVLYRPNVRRDHLCHVSEISDPYFESALLEAIPKITATNYVQYRIDFYNTIDNVVRERKWVDAIVEARSLYSYDELFAKKLLQHFISGKSNSCYIDDTGQIIPRIPRVQIYPGQPVPIVNYVEYLYRCTLCDDKLTKTIIKLKSDGSMEVNIVEDNTNLRLCHCCTMFLVNVIPDFSSLDIPSLLKFRHHRMIMTGINDYKSLFGVFPMDIIRVIIGLMYG